MNGLTQVFSLLAVYGAMGLLYSVFRYHADSSSYATRFWGVFILIFALIAVINFFVAKRRSKATGITRANTRRAASKLFNTDIEEKN